MKDIPSGFKKMELILTFNAIEQKGEIDALIKLVLYFLVRDYYIFYSVVDKFGTGEYSEFHFYCRPQDEVSIAYRMGCYNQALMKFYDRNHFKNPIHTVSLPFPETIQIPAKYGEGHVLTVGTEKLQRYDMGQKVIENPVLMVQLVPPSTAIKQTTEAITFEVDEYPVLSLLSNGVIYVNGDLAANDLDVVNGLREFVTACRQKTSPNSLLSS